MWPRLPTIQPCRSRHCRILRRYLGSPLGGTSPNYCGDDLDLCVKIFPSFPSRSVFLLGSRSPATYCSHDEDASTTQAARLLNIVRRHLGIFIAGRQDRAAAADDDEHSIWLASTSTTEEAAAHAGVYISLIDQSGATSRAYLPARRTLPTSGLD